jgi:hypothetical protein
MRTRTKIAIPEPKGSEFENFDSANLRVIPAAGLSSFAKSSVRGRVSTTLVGIECARALSLIVNPMPPRICKPADLR